MRSPVEVKMIHGLPNVAQGITSRCDVIKQFGLLTYNFAMTKTPNAQTRITKREFESLAKFRYELRRYLRYSEEITRKKGITPLQYQLLLQLKGYPDREYATVSELAERLQAKHHGVVSLVTRCEQAGLVARRIDKDDLRVVNVHLTPKGQQCLERLAELHRSELVKLKGQFFVPEFDHPREY